MKNYFLDLLDQITPATDEHKDILNVFLFGFPLFLVTLGGLLLTLI